MLNEMGTYTRNLFHVLEIDDAQGAKRGWVNSWEFGLGNGWQRSTHQSAGFPFHSGFGVDDVDDVTREIALIVDNLGDEFVYGEDIFSTNDSLYYLTPIDAKELMGKLHENHGMKLVLNEDGSLEGVGKIHRKKGRGDEGVFIIYGYKCKTFNARRGGRNIHSCAPVYSAYKEISLDFIRAAWLRKNNSIEDAYKTSNKLVEK